MGIPTKINKVKYIAPRGNRAKRCNCGKVLRKDNKSGLCGYCYETGRKNLHQSEHRKEE